MREEYHQYLTLFVNSGLIIYLICGRKLWRVNISMYIVYIYFFNENFGVYTNIFTRSQIKINIRAENYYKNMIILIKVITSYLKRQVIFRSEIPLTSLLDLK